MEKLQQARQAFKERYGATPEQKGFFTKKLGAKIVFFKNERAFKAFELTEKLTKKMIKSLTVMMMLIVIVWGWYLIVINPSDADARFGFFTLMTIAILLLIGFNTRNEVRYDNLRKSWKDQLVIYDLNEEEIIEP